MIELRSENGNLMDEVVGKDCYVHLERMDDHWFCLIIEDSDRRILLNIGTSSRYRRKVNAMVYANEPTMPSEGKDDGSR